MGDAVEFVGPRNGGIALHPEASWFILVGDETAIQAVQAILADLPSGLPTLVLIEAANPIDIDGLTVGCTTRLQLV